MNPPYTIWPFDCVDTMLHLMDPGSVHCVVTSPPYYGLRDYGTAKWVGGDSACNHAPAQKWVSDGGDLSNSTAAGLASNLARAVKRQNGLCRCGARRVDRQIGLEETPDEYVARIVEVARAVRRVLRDDGTFWLNLGDSYANDGKWGGRTGGKHAAALHRSSVGRNRRHTGLKPKDLIGIPWRVAFALQADGWYLRQEIIWSKGNPMPESVRDRCTKSHEQIFLLTKKPRYFFDADAIAEPFKTDPKENYERRARITGRGDQGAAVARGNDRGKSGGFPAPRGRRNKRSVWTVNARPFKGAHFATFPPDLIEPCILAGSPTSACARCGAPRVPDKRIVTSGRRGDGGATHAARLLTRSGGTTAATHMGTKTTLVVGFKATCRCGVGVVPAVVFDPFGGSGTTALVAIRNGRHAVLCELNPEYVEMAHLRIAGGK